MITIEARVRGQEITITDDVIVASKAAKSISLHCTFDDAWEGISSRCGIFWAQDGTAYTSVMTGDTCIVPWEAITDAGNITFGVYGVASGGVVLPTKRIILHIYNGAYGDAESGSEPTPTEWQQILAALGGLEAETPVIHWDGDTLVITKGVVV